MSLDSTRRLIYAVCDNMIHGVLMVESFLTASITCVHACVRACVRVCVCVCADLVDDWYHFHTRSQHGYDLLVKHIRAQLSIQPTQKPSMSA